MATTYESIATQTLGSAAPSITFSSIPATYTDLRVVLVGSTTDGAFLRIQLNGDTASNYSTTEIRGNGATATSDYSASTRFNVNGASTIIGNIFIISSDLFSYTGSTFKTCLNAFSNDANGSGEVNRRVGLYRSTSAITSLLLSVSTGNYAIGTTATLYGIKAA